MASSPFDRVGQNGAHGVFSRINLAELAERGLNGKGGTLKHKQSITYGHGITRPGEDPPVHFHPHSKGFSRNTFYPNLNSELMIV